VTPDHIVLGLAWFLVFLFSTTLHEAAHAFTAYRLGDPTAYEGGQVTLNPLPHIKREPFGMVLVPLITFATMGWMMGWASAPYDPAWAHRYPKRAALMALAGPIANFFLVIVAGVAIRVGIATGLFREGGLTAGAAMPLSILFSLNLLLGVFNLLPLPPLDGSAIVPAFMSPAMVQRYNAFLHQPMLSLLGLMVAWKVFPWIFAPIQGLAVRLLYAGLAQ
jgi:Zn-dependent protease